MLLRPLSRRAHYFVVFRKINLTEQKDSYIIVLLIICKRVGMSYVSII